MYVQYQCIKIRLLVLSRKPGSRSASTAVVQCSNFSIFFFAVVLIFNWHKHNYILRSGIGYHNLKSVTTIFQYHSAGFYVQSIVSLYMPSKFNLGVIVHNSSSLVDRIPLKPCVFSSSFTVGYVRSNIFFYAKMRRCRSDLQFKFDFIIYVTLSTLMRPSNLLLSGPSSTISPGRVM